MKLLQQMMAVEWINSSSKGKKDGDYFMEMVKIEKQVVRIQAKFRGMLAVQKLANDVDLQRKKLATKSKRSAAPKEALALQEFKQRLQLKAGLTPEAFYRCCDARYQKSVSCDYFKQQILQHNL